MELHPSSQHSDTTVHTDNSLSDMEKHTILERLGIRPEDFVRSQQDVVQCVFEVENRLVVGRLYPTHSETVSSLQQQGFLSRHLTSKIFTSILLSTKLESFNDPTGITEITMSPSIQQFPHPSDQTDLKGPSELVISPEAWETLRKWAVQKYSMTGTMLVVQVFPPAATIPKLKSQSRIVSGASMRSDQTKPVSMISPRMVDTESFGVQEEHGGTNETFSCLGCEHVFIMDETTKQVQKHVGGESERKMPDGQVRSGWYCYPCLSVEYQSLVKEKTDQKSDGDAESSLPASDAERMNKILLQMNPAFKNCPDCVQYLDRHIALDRDIGILCGIPYICRQVEIAHLSHDTPPSLTPPAGIPSALICQTSPDSATSPTDIQAAMEFGKLRILQKQMRPPLPPKRERKQATQAGCGGIHLVAYEDGR